MPKRKLVMVEWVDSHGSEGWCALDRLAENNQILNCKSVGWVIAESKKAITICPHLSGDDDENVRTCGRGELTIPRVAVLAIRNLS